jgi:hypothetical protein
MSREMPSLSRRFLPERLAPSLLDPLDALGEHQVVEHQVPLTAIPVLINSVTSPKWSLRHRLIYERTIDDRGRQLSAVSLRLPDASPFGHSGFNRHSDFVLSRQTAPARTQSGIARDAGHQPSAQPCQ